MRCAEAVLLQVRASAATLAVVLAVATPITAGAQVRLAATAGTYVYAGATEGQDPTARPHGSYAWGGAVSFQRGVWLARVGANWSEPGVIIGDDAVQVTDRSVLDLMVVEGTLGWRALTTGTGANLLLEAGPSVHRWTPVGEDARTKVGATAAIVWRQPATRHVDLSVRAHAATSPSPFTQDDLPSELHPATLWRWGVTLELGWRL